MGKTIYVPTLRITGNYGQLFCPGGSRFDGYGTRQAIWDATRSASRLSESLEAVSEAVGVKGVFVVGLGNCETYLEGVVSINGSKLGEAGEVLDAFFSIDRVLLPRVIDVHVDRGYLMQVEEILNGHGCTLRQPKREKRGLDRLAFWKPEVEYGSRVRFG